MRRGNAELVPAEAVEQQHGDPVDAGEGGAEAEGVALVRHPEHTEHAGHDLGQAGLPVARCERVERAHQDFRASRCSWVAMSR